MYISKVAAAALYTPVTWVHVFNAMIAALFLVEHKGITVWP